EESVYRSKLMHKIEASYAKRLDSRPKHRRAAADYLICDLCFGLLDPISNILGERRGEGALEDLKRRSLDGLVAFLTRLFPDLAESQAVRYLLLADADLLVAARIVVSDIGMKRFEASGTAVTEALNMALKCAALAAGHSDPARLVYGAMAGTSGCKCKDHSGCKDDLLWAWQLAAFRRLSPCKVPFQHTRLLNRTLQDVIHGFYLQALARLPASELRSRFHRSLLKSGPLDPVSNIIINTIWYDAAFPRTHELELGVVGTRSLHRVENSSLYGMASFLSTRYRHIDFHEAVRCLLQADANLLLADPNLDPSSPSGVQGGLLMCGADACLCNAQTAQDPDTSIQGAFLAASTAACHPNPDAQVKLLTSCKAMLGSALSLLQGCHKLSSEDVRRLAMLLSPESPSEKPLPPLPLTGYPRAKVADAHTRISKRVKAVLKAYEQMLNGDQTFELHMICGVNDCVSGPVGSCHIFYHSHVNFVASTEFPRGSASSVLFFAEISTDGNDKSFCCPVSLPPPCAPQSRCLYCEFMGIRIVHPVGIDFHGRELEFEKVVCGEDPCGENIVPILRKPFYNNLDIVNNRTLIAEAVEASKDSTFQ
ncbi:hypothetical protein PVAP13_5KG090100, partial [Panicum virgatum]